MVAHLLHRCGLHLGADGDLLPARPDNPDGFWEHREFVALNDALLEALGGSWDVPPPARTDWARDPALLPLRHRAVALVSRVATAGSWGWKDPRNSLTLAFWQLLLPDLRVVVCVRNPLAVVRSLADRGANSETFGLRLWRTYHERLLAAVPQEARVVTHYDAWFHDPAAELRRVCDRLGLAPTADAAAAIRPALRHHRPTTTDLLSRVRDAGVVDTYLRLCAEAGPVHAETLEREPGPPMAACVGPEAEAHLEALLRARVEHLERALAERGAEHAALRARAEALAVRLAARDEELALAQRLQRADRDVAARATATLAQREQDLTLARAGLVDLRAQLERVTSSRLWPLMQTLWRLRLRLVPYDSRRERVLGMQPHRH